MTDETRIFELTDNPDVYGPHPHARLEVMYAPGNGMGVFIRAYDDEGDEEVDVLVEVRPSDFYRFMRDFIEENGGE